MQISPISFRAQSFQARQPQQPQSKRAQKVDNQNTKQGVTFSYWGGNYAYPVITEQTEYQQRAKNALEGCDETPEEY